MNAEERLYRSVGGKPLPIKTGGREEVLWSFGWIPPMLRTREQEEELDKAVKTMPKFGIVGRTRYNDEKKHCLFELWSHPLVKQSLGFSFQGVHQITGSCVGAAGGAAVFSTSLVEIVRYGDPEKIIIPFWLLPYGRSRYYAGMRGRGEGSLGGTFAKAAREDGFLDAGAKGLPPYKNTDGLIWGSKAEYEWSDGAAISPSHLNLSRQHPTKTVARCRDHNDVREAIVNGFACTAASMFGTRARVEEGVLLGRWNARWAHQMSYQAWWEHPRLGELFWCHNQWGLDAHGRDPAGGPLGGFWMLASDVDRVCRDEVYAFSQFEGFPALIDWFI